MFKQYVKYHWRTGRNPISCFPQASTVVWYELHVYEIRLRRTAELPSIHDCSQMPSMTESQWNTVLIVSIPNTKAAKRTSTTDSALGLF